MAPPDRQLAKGVEPCEVTHSHMDVTRPTPSDNSVSVVVN